MARARGSGAGESGGFGQWAREEEEITYLLDTLSFKEYITAIVSGFEPFLEFHRLSKSY